MVKNEKENRSKTPARQAFQEMRREANKIEASTPYQFNGKNLGFFGDCAPKKWPFGQIGPRAVSEKARSAISRQPSASDQHSA